MPLFGAFEPIALSGKGAKVARFTIPEAAVAIARITFKGSGNFAVWTVDASGSETDLLVNTIGNYVGTVLFDTSGHSVAFSIEASSGSWTATISPIAAARNWNISGGRASGNGDDVLWIQGGVSGLTTAVMTHTGESNFAVWAWGTESAELLVNEIGRYNGEVLLPSGTVLLQVTADGAWTVTPT